MTISSLLVRHEFCKQVTEVGGLDLIRDVMTQYTENEVSSWLSIISISTYFNIVWKFNEKTEFVFRKLIVSASSC